jgi:hypothetical protein
MFDAHAHLGGLDRPHRNTCKNCERMTMTRGRGRLNISGVLSARRNSIICDRWCANKRVRGHTREYAD